MRIKSFKQFVRETIEAPNEPQDNALLRLTVHHLIAAIEQHFEEDSLVTVRLDCPDTDSIAVSFNAQGEARDDSPDERRLLTFGWSISELRKDLALWADNYKVQITMDEEGKPEKIWMVFTRDDSGD